MADQKTCFVVMGFGQKTDYRTSRVLDLDKTYKHIIKPAVEAAGLCCVRADEIPHSGSIDVPMYEHLLESDLVVCDLSTANVNAVYELGIRHALRPNSTIIIAEDQFSFPFDVNHIAIRTFRHDGKALDIDVVMQFRSDLQRAIEAIMSAGRADSPVYTYLHSLRPPVRRVQTEAGSAAVSAFPPADATNQVAQTTLAALTASIDDAKRRSDFVTAKSLLAAAVAMAPRDVYLVQQLAVATYKAKLPSELAALEAAREILQPLEPLSSNDAETLGIAGAIHKRLWQLGGQREQLDQAIVCYEKGYWLLDDPYNGINLAYLLNVRATLSEPADAIADFVLAQRVRKRVFSLCEAALRKLEQSQTPARETYWMLATQAEAALGSGQPGLGSELMARAKPLAEAQWMVETTERQLGALTELLKQSPLSVLGAGA